MYVPIYVYLRHVIALNFPPLVTYNSLKSFTKATKKSIHVVHKIQRFCLYFPYINVKTLCEGVSSMSVWGLGELMGIYHLGFQTAGVMP